LIKKDYDEGRLQPTPASHPQLATPRVNYFLLVVHCYSQIIGCDCPKGKYMGS
jgi:hypothetical protein